MLKILIISVLGIASASVFRDFKNGMEKLSHNRVVEHFVMGALDKVESLSVEQKINAFIKKMSHFPQQNESPVPAVSKPGTGRPLKLGKYLFQNCSAAAAQKATVAIRSLTITPDPAQIPGTLTIQFDVNNLQDITQLAINVEMYLTEGGTTQKLPCFGGLLGSCVYENVCDLLAVIPECPEQFQQLKIPCQCPFGKGTYFMPGISVSIGAEVFLSGDYNVTANMYTKEEGDFIGCYNMQFTIET